MLVYRSKYMGLSYNDWSKSCKPVLVCVVVGTTKCLSCDKYKEKAADWQNELSIGFILWYLFRSLYKSTTLSSLVIFQTFRVENKNVPVKYLSWFKLYSSSQCYICIACDEAIGIIKVSRFVETRISSNDTLQPLLLNINSTKSVFAFLLFWISFCQIMALI